MALAPAVNVFAREPHEVTIQNDVIMENLENRDRHW